MEDIWDTEKLYMHKWGKRYPSGFTKVLLKGFGLSSYSIEKEGRYSVGFSTLSVIKTDKVISHLDTPTYTKGKAIIGCWYDAATGFWYVEQKRTFYTLAEAKDYAITQQLPVVWDELDKVWYFA